MLWSSRRCIDHNERNTPKGDAQLVIGTFRLVEHINNRKPKSIVPGVVQQPWYGMFVNDWQCCLLPTVEHTSRFSNLPFRENERTQDGPRTHFNANPKVYFHLTSDAGLRTKTCRILRVGKCPKKNTDGQTSRFQFNVQKRPNYFTTYDPADHVQPQLYPFAFFSFSFNIEQQRFTFSFSA
jgi:hypothetical protein